MTTNKYLTYRGDIRAVAACPDSLAVVTVHPDGLPTAVYRLNVAKMELDEVALPCGGVSLIARGKDLWAGGDDARIYHLAGKAKTMKPLPVELPAPATAFAALADDRLAAICGEKLLIIATQKPAILQQFDLPEKGVSVAAEPEGTCFAAGMSKGSVAVYQLGDNGEFQISETEKIHDGAVTSLLFEPEELRFFSAGADQKLLLTHASGKLEPEDRGRGAGHDDHITAMLHVAGERFITVSRDRSCKTWARAGATRPATFNDSVPVVVDAATVEIHGRTHLALAGADNTLRFVLIDKAGRFGAMTHRLYDAYSRAEQLLNTGDVAQRGDALHSLAEYDDTRSVEMIARQVQEDNDAGLRLRACQLLAKSSHARAAKLLEPLLEHADEKVRLVAFEGLVAASEKGSRRPLELALQSGQANVGLAAVYALEPLAKKDEQAQRLLIRTFNNDPPEVRQGALLCFEKVAGKNSPEPVTLAVKSQKADTRRLGLIRAFQRGLLEDTRVAGAVRRSGEDDNAEVRQTAFLVALLSRSKLAKAIRERDKDLHRLLFELENFSLEPAKGAGKKSLPQVKPAKFSLTTEDYEPLLSAMSSRRPDTCLLGARCLALLGDARALGALLQLSREDDEVIRVQVCQALATLADARAAQRLETLVDDNAAKVRDAAYTALENIHDKAPLEAADTGLKSAHVDIRLRGLKSLSAAMRKSRKKTLDARSRELMLRALNDSDASVSGEAFKTSLGLKIDGSADAALRFALNSVRTNVRREVLTEAMANDKQAWAQELLNSLLNDPSPTIRADAYEHMVKKGKRRDIAPMQAALNSRYADVRQLATESLIKLKTKASQQVLLQAIDDEEPDVRKEAINALINLNNVEMVQTAMSSRHTDVRLIAACARAMFVDSSAKDPLLKTVTTPEPSRDADKPQWEKEAVVALGGLGMLGLEEFVPQLLPLLDSKHEAIRRGAASAIIRCARPEQTELLKPFLQHGDSYVQFRIALGLAFCQDTVALPLVFSSDATKVLEEKDRLMAAVAYGAKTQSHLIAMLDSSTAWIRNAAFLVLLMRDRQNGDGASRVLAALSASDARLRLAAAKAIEAFAGKQPVVNCLVNFLNDRGEQQEWKISEEQVTGLAGLVVSAAPRCQAQMMTVLECLDAKTQDEWDFAWHIYQIRYASEMKQAKKSQPKLEDTTPGNAAELLQLAFGTYVGLVREQGGQGVAPSFGKTIIAVRREAIRQLVAMAVEDETAAGAVRPVLIQALSDSYQPVRSLAFEMLPQVGCDEATRAAAAIECGHTDLAVEAFKLLSAGAGKKGQKVLEDVVLTRDDALATEAATLLMRMSDATTAAIVALESPHARTRSLAVNWLSGAYEESDQAKQALADAYNSRYQAVRRDAAIALARKKDTRAFEMLIEQLPQGLTKSIQFRIINALLTLGDPRSPAGLLTVLQEDKDKSLDPAMIFSTIGSFRQPEVAQQLLPLLEKKPWQTAVARCLQQISGHDQWFDASDDEHLNRTWMEEQHPRHDEVLARYIERCIDLNLPRQIAEALPAARWSLSDAVDPVLPLLCVHADDSLRNAAVEAIGWRLRKRGGPADPLREALKSRDTTTKFLAAEGLARGGHDDGVTVLLSAVELMSDLRLRMRAVEALGELGDQRALEVLLKLVNEDGHALQDSAAAAIGHLGASSRADEIAEILLRLANSEGSVAARAIIGLRHLDTPKGWDLIREKTRMGDNNREVLLEQLGYNDTAESRQLLLDEIEYYADAALPAAKRLFGEESLEPDYAAVASDDYYVSSEINNRFRCLQRVCEQGDPQRILEILPKSNCREELATALMQREPLPVEAAAKGLESTHAEVVEVAAAIVGRAGVKSHGKKLGQAISDWSEKWEERRIKLLRDSDWYDGANEEITRALCRLSWAVGRTGVSKKPLVTLLETNTDVAAFAKVRRAAAMGLSDGKLTKAEITSLTKLLEDNDAAIRKTVAGVLSHEDAGQAALHADALLSDRPVFKRLTAQEVDTQQVMADHASHAHYQAIVLPALVQATEADRLSEVASDTTLGDATRLGAVEGLACIASAKADKLLESIGQDNANGEDIQKAAWRGLRRSKRTQAKAV